MGSAFHTVHYFEFQLCRQRQAAICLDRNSPVENCPNNLPLTIMAREFKVEQLNTILFRKASRYRNR